VPDARVHLAGLDLTEIGLGDDGATALTGAHHVAHLTVDPELQRTALSLMARDHLPEAAVVMIDPADGRVLVYASHVERGESRDLCAQASAPAASIFKIVTAAALVDDASLTPDTRQCYSGGEQRILPSDLVEDPARDRWCVTLAGALGRSVNAVFARLAQRHLTPEQLTNEAHGFAFDEQLAFDVAVEASTLRVPTDPLGFARTAAGFWNTTLSPLHAAWISATIARGGEAIRPFIVRDVVGPNEAPLFVSGSEAPTRHVVAVTTSQALTTMMERTVAEGTSYRAFHDAKGTSFLPGVAVAGKTGTLTDDHAHRFYTWFTGFAPSRPTAGVHEVAVAALVVNDPTWRIKANVVARQMLQAYFAQQKVPGVTRPALGARSRP
jgi:penicillin-binding protein A